MRATHGERIDVIDLQSFFALTSRAVRRNKGALPAISHGDFVANVVGYMSR
jgi:hypothetical protein